LGNPGLKELVEKLKADDQEDAGDDQRDDKLSAVHVLIVADRSFPGDVRRGLRRRLTIDKLP